MFDLYSVKTGFYFFGYFDKDKPKKVVPLCQVKRHSEITNQKHNKTCMMLFHDESRIGLKQRKTDALLCLLRGREFLCKVGKALKELERKMKKKLMSENM